MDEAALSALRADPIDWRYKGFPAAVPPPTPATIAERGWSLLRGDLPLPVLALRDDAVEANIATMRAWCAAQGASLAPHGKTTMAPELFRRQLDAGAWAITVATIAQARVCAAFGVPRVLIANEVADPAGLAWIGEAQRAGTEIWLLVDAPVAVERLVATRRPGDPPVRVLIEIGMPDGRAGARDAAAPDAAARAAHDAEGGILGGGAGWEGHINGDDPAVVEARVDAYLGEVRHALERFAAAGLLDAADEVVASAGGSAWFDRVAVVLRPAIDRPVRLVLRSGCTVTHDEGLYRRLSPFERGRIGDGALVPALEAWAAVLSQPEPGLAILGMGKRDVPFDIDLPAPRWRVRDGALEEIGACDIVALNDQHAFLRGPAADGLLPGDVVVCGVSHPCTAFDKWRLLPLVDAERRVTGALHTFF
ncbi:MAG: alanine racemase [Gaiellales bacterium]